MKTKHRKPGRRGGPNLRTVAVGAAAVGVLVLLTVPASAAHAAGDQTCGDGLGVCLKLAREGTSVDFAQAYHDGRTGPWEGKIDLIRMGHPTIQGAVGKPPPPATQNEHLNYPAGATICARGYEMPDLHAKGEACITL
ncbi:hypothetical protein [Actinomadura sp. 9N215]|uniref:hypothetical protein n=1 Tax=Actinomadura sp. 9N215 TaxID=3375150 RepID=UPI0037902B6F